MTPQMANTPSMAQAMPGRQPSQTPRMQPGSPDIGMPQNTPNNMMMQGGGQMGQNLTPEQMAINPMRGWNGVDITSKLRPTEREVATLGTEFRQLWEDSNPYGGCSANSGENTWKLSSRFLTHRIYYDRLCGGIFL